jgi:hypothetical protein
MTPCHNPAAGLKLLLGKIRDKMILFTFLEEIFGVTGSLQQTAV